MYINETTQQYPLSEREIREVFPNTSFAEPFNPDGFAVVFTSPQPEFNQYTQTCREAAPLFTDKGHWEQQWLTMDLEGEELTVGLQRQADDLATADAQRIASLWQAAHDYEYAEISGSAVALLSAGFLQSKPKAIAIAMWCDSIWNGVNGFYARRDSGSTDTDFSNVGPIPFTIPELSAEVLGV